MKLHENDGFKHHLFLQQICKEIHCPDCNAVSCQVCLSWVSDSGSLKEPPPKVWHSFFNINLSKCDSTKFDGKVHSISYYMDRTDKGKLSWNQFRVIYTETRGTKGWVSLSCWATRFPVPPSSFWNSWWSLGWISVSDLDNGLCLKELTK